MAYGKYNDEVISLGRNLSRLSRLRSKSTKVDSLAYARSRLKSFKFENMNDVPLRVCIRKKELVKRGYADFADWKSDPTHAYVGRNMSFFVKGATESIFHNPFKVLPKGPYTLEDALASYKTHIELCADLVEQLHIVLEYKEIGCWCAHGEQKCHAQILIDLAKKQAEEEDA
jgi:hypothetical protein